MFVLEWKKYKLEDRSTVRKYRSVNEISALRLNRCLRLWKAFLKQHNVRPQIYTLPGLVFRNTKTADPNSNEPLVTAVTSKKKFDRAWLFILRNNKAKICIQTFSCMNLIAEIFCRIQTNYSNTSPKDKIKI